MVSKETTKKSLASVLEAQHAEVVGQLQTTVVLLPDNSSLAQPSPFKVYPTVVTYSAYEEPIIAS